MHPILKWSLISVAILLLAAAVGLSIMAGSPKDAIGMVRYALPHMHRGNLQVGSDAPDATRRPPGGPPAFPHPRAHQRQATRSRFRQLHLTAVPSPGWRRRADL